MVGTLIFITYFVSLIWSLFFLEWMIEHNITPGIGVFTVMCPILNTMFVIYRTYRHFKNGGKIFLHDLFAD